MSSSNSETLRANGLRLLIELAVGVTVLAASLTSGCATTDEGDMPWNAPQPWEGSPGIPGLPQY